jgi:hypothetical protein
MKENGGCQLSRLIQKRLNTKKGHLFCCSWREVSPFWPELDDDWKEVFTEAVRRNAWFSFSFVANADVLDKRRKEWAKHCDEMKALQKECGKNRDAENARFFKQEANEAMKHYRGCCLVLGHLLNSPPGDSPFVPTSKWPLELCDYAVTNMLETN